MQKELPASAVASAARSSSEVALVWSATLLSAVAVIATVASLAFEILTSSHTNAELSGQTKEITAHGKGRQSPFAEDEAQDPSAKAEGAHQAPPRAPAQRAR